MKHTCPNCGTVSNAKEITFKYFEWEYIYPKEYWHWRQRKDVVQLVGEEAIKAAEDYMNKFHLRHMKLVFFCHSIKIDREVKE